MDELKDALAKAVEDQMKHGKTTLIEALINQEAYEALSADLQAIVTYACQAANADMYADFEASNGEALKILVEEHGVELRAFPDEVLDELRRASFEVIEELVARDEMAAKVWASLSAYIERVKASTAIGSQYFVNRR